MFERRPRTSRPSTARLAGTSLGRGRRDSGLLMLIFALARTHRGALAAPAVGAYIGAAYWFTSSTSFANPAVTIGRMFSDTFAGIAPTSVPRLHRHAAHRRSSSAIALILVLYPDAGRASADDVVDPASPAGDQPTCTCLRKAPTMHLVAIGGSDAGISAALRARELDPSVDVTVVVADAYPNFSICGIPYYFSGEVQPLASPRPPHPRRPRSHRHAAAPGHPRHLDRRRPASA